MVECPEEGHARRLYRGFPFDRHRALPDGVAEKVRAALIAALGSMSHGADAADAKPRLLDIGAGTGRTG